MSVIGISGRSALIQRPTGPVVMNRSSPHARSLQCWLPVNSPSRWQLDPISNLFFSPADVFASVVGVSGVHQGVGLYSYGNGFRSDVAAPTFDAITCAVWTQRVSSLGLNYRSVASHHTTNGSASDWYLYYYGDNTIRIDIPWVAGNVLISTKTYANVDQRLIVFTRSGSSGSWTYRLYTDGVLDTSNTTASNHNTGAHNYNIMTLATGAGYTAYSNVWDFRVWNRELSAGEVWSLFDPRTRWDLYQCPEVVPHMVRLINT